jgi:hypothetical protein
MDAQSAAPMSDEGCSTLNVVSGCDPEGLPNQQPSGFLNELALRRERRSVNTTGQHSRDGMGSRACSPARRNAPRYFQAMTQEEHLLTSVI